MSKCGGLWALLLSSYVFKVFLNVFSRYLSRVVSHPLLLQDPDVREFLEREEVRDFLTKNAFLLNGVLCGFKISEKGPTLALPSLDVLSFW